MGSDEIKLVVSRLDGYLDAVASIEGTFRDNIGCAFLAEIDENNFDASLLRMYEADSNYRFLSCRKIEPWLEILEREIQAVILKDPFGAANDLNDRLSKPRFELGWQILEMIRIASADYRSKYIYKVSCESGSDYSGTLYLVPLNKQYLVVQFMSKINA